MKYKSIHYCFCAFFILSLYIASSIFYTTTAQSGDKCDKENLPTDKEELRKIIVICEAEIENEQRRLQNLQRERTNTERDISIIDSDIKSGELEVRSLGIQISKLNGEISDIEENVDTLTTDIENYKDIMGNLIQSINAADSRSFAHIFFAENSISNFLSDVEDYNAIQFAAQSTIEDIDRRRNRLNRYGAVLHDTKLGQAKAKSFQETQVVQNRILKDEKQGFLTVQKKQEKGIAENIKSREQLVAEIRSRLFDLRGSKAIPFGEALDYAQFAEKTTGVRAAFLLGIIKQESALGKNVGTGNWNEEMHPSRDKPIFRDMAKEIGFDPNKVPVSKRLSYGWGGAMGPAQFIPSTWTCYGGIINTETDDCRSRTISPGKYDNDGPWKYNKNYDRIRAITGSSVPSDPWQPRDAFIGSALLLKDNGAAANEFCAALRYYSGSCSTRNQKLYGFYPRSVLALAKQIQADIDFLGE